MRRAREGMIYGVLCLTVLAGCAAARPSTQPALPSPSSTDRYGAPDVTAARDVGAVAAAPCDRLLTRTELKGLGFPAPGKARQLFGVTECSWDAPDGQNLRMYADPSRDLLVDTYRTQRRGFFQPTTIDGIPAVRQKTSAGDLNICTITTGLGPTQALETTWNGVGDPGPGNDACESAEQATALVIRKLPPQR